MSHKLKDIFYENLNEQIDSEFESMWLKGNRERFVKRQAEFFTETIPNDLKRLDKVAQAFSKVKLNERGLPW